MERRFAVRQQEMLAECEVREQVLEGLLERLTQFVQSFAGLLGRSEQRRHALAYLRGLLSDLKRKNVESIAYRDDQDRQGLQHFIGCAPWDHRPLQQELVRQVGAELGQDDGVIVFDPSAFPKKGQQSVGVARQWCGRLGKVDNCQVGVYMGYVSRAGHTLVDVRLYLPKQWTSDRRRCRAAGVPKDVKFQTRHTQALEMLDAHSDALPHTWVAGDDEMGQNAVFRCDLHQRQHQRQQQYLLAVPAKTTVRDLQADPPPQRTPGAAPKRRFESVAEWTAARENAEWTRVTIRDGEKGPLEVELVCCRVQARLNRRIMPYEETLVVIRYRDDAGTHKTDYYLSDANANTPPAEFARVAKAGHRIEECIKRGKSEAGLADYEVRHWKGWHHHQILSLLAGWFLVLETRRGKKTDARDHGSSNPRDPRPAPAGRLRL